MSVSARRDNLKSIPFWPQFQPHAGLWFDKYLREQKSDTLEPYLQHIGQTSEIKEPPVYNDFFNRWRDEIERAGAILQEAYVLGRLTAGLGGETVIEAGLTLHHTYGVPYIPGSSLKGTARAYAVANLEGMWSDNGTAFRTLFGGLAIPPGKQPEEKGRVGIAVFHDALPVPGSWRIYTDVMTVHHKLYYSGDASSPPADWDSPTPIPFPSVNGRFLIVIYAPYAPEWAESAMDILKMALAESGVGGKTSSGYGRMYLDKNVTALPEEDVLSQFRQQLADLPHNRVANELNRFVEQWRSFETDQFQKRHMAQAILDKVEEVGRTQKSKEKGWYQELAAYIQSANE